MEQPDQSETYFSENPVVEEIDNNEALEVEAVPLVAVVLPGQTPPASQAEQLPQPPVRAAQDNFVCSEESCLEEFATLKELRRHSKMHAEEKPHKCDKCSMSFNVEYNLTLHKAIHQEGRLECPDCKKKFSRLASLKAHIMLHEREESLICSECGDEFGLQRELHHHILSHSRQSETIQHSETSRNSAGEYPCGECSEVFPLHQHLKEHVRLIHIGSRGGRRKGKPVRYYANNACPHCPKSFPKPSQLVRHVRIHTGEKPFSCHICAKSFNQKGALSIHMVKHTKAKPFACKQCPISFSQRGNLRAHVVRVHELNSKLDNPFRCEECNCIFRKLGSLNSHISKFHSSTENPLALLRLGALRLNKQLATTGSLMKEAPATTQGSKEPVSAVTTVSTVNPDEDAPVNIMDIPVEDLSPPPPAASTEETVLGEQSTLDQSLNDIIQRLLELTQVTEVPSEQQFINQEEESRTSSFSTGILEQALEDCGLQTNRSEDQPPPETNPGLATTAEDVVKVFTQILKRRRAMRSNTSRTHTCDFCKKDFKKPSDLVRHIRTHTQERPFQCQLCWKTFTVKSTLTTHLKTHSGLKEYKCHVCQKLFATHSSLKIHLRLHTGAKPFECRQCSKRFRTSGQRNVHCASHSRMQDPGKSKASKAKTTSSDADLQYISLPEPILITDNGLVQQMSRNNLPLLESMHSAFDRPYKCGYCGKAFKKSSHLKQHIRTHTGERPFRCHQCAKSFVSSGVLRSHFRVHTGDKAYKCVICDRHFTTNGSLKRHMATHSDVRPFMCPYCQKTFKTSLNCKKHMKTHKQELLDGKLPQETIVPPNSAAIAEPMQPDQSQEISTEQLLNQLAADALQTQAQQDSNQNPLLQPTSLTQEVLSQASLGGPANLTNVSQFVQGLVSQDMMVGSGQDALPSVDPQVSLQTQEIQQQLEAITGQTLLPPPPPPVPLPAPPSVPPEQQLNLSEPMASQMSQDLSPMLTLDKILAKRSFRCEYCGKSFKKSSHLKQHVRSHTGDKPFQCPQCLRSFVSSGVLKNHLRTHSGSKPYECGSCGAVFTTNGSLSRHMAIHTDERRHICPRCHAHFRTPTELARHERQHDEAYNREIEKISKRPAKVLVLNESEKEKLASEAPPPGAPLSQKILVQLSNEKGRIHEIVDKIKQLESAPKFANACDRCPKSFRKHCDLVRHLRIHTGEKPFSCDVCGKAFAVKSTLSCHMRTHRGFKQASCHICKTMFATVGSLKVHMRLHTGAKPYKCPKCPMHFRTSGSRKVHMESHFSGTKKRKLVKEALEEAGEGEGQDVEQVTVLQSITCDTDDPAVQQVFVSQAAVPTSMIAAPMPAGALAGGEATGTDGLVTTAVVPIELQLNAASLTQNPNITVQIDSSLFQQLQQNPITLQAGSDIGQINLQLAGNEAISSQPTLVALQQQAEIPLEGDGGQGATEPPPMILQLDQASLQQLAQMNVANIQPQLSLGDVGQVSVPQLLLQPGGVQSLLETQQAEGVGGGRTVIVTHPGQSLLETQPTEGGIGGGTVIVTQPGQSLLETQTEAIRSGTVIVTQPGSSEVQQISLGAPILSTGIQNDIASSQAVVLDLSGIDIQQPADKTPTSTSTSLMTALSMVNSGGLSTAHQDGVTSEPTTVNLNRLEVEQAMNKAAAPVSANLMSGLSISGSEGLSMSNSGGLSMTTGGSGGESFQLNIGSISFRPVQSPPALPRSSQLPSTSVTPTPESRRASDMLVSEVSEIFTPTLLQDGLRSMEDAVGESMPSSSMMRSSGSPTPSATAELLQTPTTPSRKRKRRSQERPTLTVTDAAAAIGSLYPCVTQGCSEEFTSMSELRAHQESSHKSLRPHQCPVCSKSFKRSTHLKEHVEIHNPDRRAVERAIYPCRFCNKTFTKPSLVERHLRSHTGDRPFDCPECGKSFTQKNSLTTHMKTHTKEKPFTCQFCGHNFSQKVNMKTHIERVHRMAAATEAATKELERGGGEVTPGSSSGTDREDTLDIENVMSRFFP